MLDPETANRTDTEIDTFTQEFRLSGATDNMNWMGGVYLFDEEVLQETGILYGDAFRAYSLSHHLESDPEPASVYLTAAGMHRPPRALCVVDRRVARSPGAGGVTQRG